MGAGKGYQETRRLAFTIGSITLCPLDPHRENPTEWKVPCATDQMEREQDMQREGRHQ
jgi:hypothetical protein